MEEYKKGTKFEICPLEYLTDVMGWVEVDDLPGNFNHVDFYGLTISRFMIEDYQGRTLTTISRVSKNRKNWYEVKENAFFWPVATFLFDLNPCKEICMHIKGQTPIFGWVICKLCGTNLEEIK